MTKETKTNNYAVYLTDSQNARFQKLIELVNKELGIEQGPSQTIRMLILNRCNELGIK